MEIKASAQKRMSFSREVISSFYYINEKIPVKDLEPLYINSAYTNLCVAKDKEITIDKIENYARERNYQPLTLNEFLGSEELIYVIIKQEKYHRVGAIILGTEIKEKQKIFVPIVYRDSKKRLILDLILKDYSLKKEEILWNNQFIFPHIVFDEN